MRTNHYARILTIVAAVAFATPRPSAAQVTIEDLMASPFPSILTASPSSDAIAWVENDEGVRNVWIARAPSYTPRQLTAYTLDDGQDIGPLAWSADGTRLIYVRGGGPNRRGEIPNPTSAPEPAERAIWLVEVAGGTPRRLADGSQPTPSPDGGTLAFIRQGQVWSVNLEGDPVPEQLFQIRGGAGSLRWSPSGDRLAFVSTRGDHAFLGVFSLGDRSVRYLDPSVDRDGNPAWSPDGRRLAFTRTPNDRSRLPFMPQREALPWSIRVADVASGAGREVWMSDPGPGSAFNGVVSDNQIFWGEDDLIVFPWERDGWLHLYSVPVRGGDARLLTPGAFEVEDVVMTADRRTILFSSNQDDIDRRHLWRVAVAGGRVEAVTSGDGIEWSPAPLADGRIAFLASDARTPAHAVIADASGNRTTLTDLTGFPSASQVVPEQVIFSAADGMRIHGQLFRPAGLRAGDRRAAVIFFHGGSRRQMLLGWHYRGYYHNAYALNQYLASRGFIVLSVNYRSGIGYGMEFREALRYGATGASEYNDVEGAGLYLRSRDDVDPERIGLWGGSYGGYLTAMGLARGSDLFAAGVDVHGVHDWNVVIQNFVPDYDPTARPDHARLAYESSPMASIDDWRSPVLIIHGDDDRNVPFSESVDLAESLRQRGVEVEQLIFPDEVHGFLLHRNWLAAYRAAADFLRRRLAAAATEEGS